MISLRRATPGDLPALQILIPQSVRALSRGYYTERQVESALRYVFGVDTQLIADGTYFIAEADGDVAGCGGWSRRRTLYGGDQNKAAGQEPGADDLLDPARDPARIRAFFVHPDRARRGVGTLLLDACIGAARGAGFDRLELMATLPGVALYRRAGFTVIEHVAPVLPDGVAVPFARMGRALAGPDEQRGCVLERTVE